MTVFTEGRHAAEGLMSEANFHRSRDTITILSGSGVLKPGTVLGAVKVGAATAAAKSGGNTGDATISAVTLGKDPKAGVYQVRFTAATKFDVIDPEGFKLKSGATGVAYSDDLGFTITAGSTPMVEGDGFDITVATGSKKFVPSPNTAGDGSEDAAAILLHEVDATSADVKVAAITRDAEWNVNTLSYHASVDDAGKRAAKHDQLAAVGIIAR